MGPARSEAEGTARGGPGRGGPNVWVGTGFAAAGSRGGAAGGAAMGATAADGDGPFGIACSCCACCCGCGGCSGGGPAGGSSAEVRASLGTGSGAMVGSAGRPPLAAACCGTPPMPLMSAGWGAAVGNADAWTGLHRYGNVRVQSWGVRYEGTNDGRRVSATGEPPPSVGGKGCRCGLASAAGAAHARACAGHG